MTTLKVREVLHGLEKKGFFPSEGDHTFLIFYVGGARTPSRMRALKREQEGEKHRQAIHDMEDEQLKRSFGEQFLQGIATVSRAKMPNKNLQAFAETLKKKREDEIKYLVTATDMFS